MPLSNNINLYADVRSTLDLALRSNGGELRLASRNEAIHWTHRANKFRKLLGASGPTPYDGMRFRVNEATVTIELAQPQGQFIPRSAPEPELEEDFDLAEAIAEAERKLKEQS